MNISNIHISNCGYSPNILKSVHKQAKIGRFLERRKIPIVLQDILDEFTEIPSELKEHAEYGVLKFLLGFLAPK